MRFFKNVRKSERSHLEKSRRRKGKGQQEVIRISELLKSSENRHGTQ